MPFIYQWLTSTWPPRMIQAALDRTKLVGLEYLPVDIRKRLLEWVEFVQKRVSEENVTLEVVKRFLRVLKVYVETLGNVAAL